MKKVCLNILIFESVVLLSSVLLCIAAVFFNNQCCLPLLSLEIFCIVRCSEIIDSRGDETVNHIDISCIGMLTAGLLVLHALKWIKCSLARWSSVRHVSVFFFVL